MIRAIFRALGAVFWCFAWCIIGLCVLTKNR